MTDIQALQQQSWRISEEHGFHAAQEALPPKTLATYLKLFLTIGELVEAGEELRAGRLPTEVYYKFDITGTPEGVVFSSNKPWALVTIDPESPNNPHFELYRERFELVGPYECHWIPGKPEGFPMELADALIRLCDLAEDVGVDLAGAAELKAAYNRTREFLHGKTA